MIAETVKELRFGAPFERTNEPKCWESCTHTGGTESIASLMNYAGPKEDETIIRLCSQSIVLRVRSRGSVSQYPLSLVPHPGRELSGHECTPPRNGW